MENSLQKMLMKTSVIAFAVVGPHSEMPQIVLKTTFRPLLGSVDG
jgi:hypothetical protein